MKTTTHQTKPRITVKLAQIRGRVVLEENGQPRIMPDLASAFDRIRTLRRQIEENRCRV